MINFKKLRVKLFLSFFDKLYKVSPFIPYTFTNRLQYRLIMKEKLNYKNPKNFNQKIQWIKAFGINDKYINGADKLKVRDYVKDVGLEKHLVKLLGVYNDAAQINLNSLPSAFVIKTNNGSGTNIIVREKDNFDISNSINTINDWKDNIPGVSYGELHYSKIEPKIIVEEFLDDGKNDLPLDYKIFCFNGQPDCIRISDERDTKSGKSKQVYFDFDWNELEYVKPEYRGDSRDYQKPYNLKKMYEIAEILSKPFPFVRVDLYNINGKIYFGELTFTPTGGFGMMFNNEANVKFGNKLKLPNSKKLSYD